MAKRSTSRSRTSAPKPSHSSSSGRRGRPRKDNSSAMNLMPSNGQGRRDYMRMMKNLTDRTAFRYAVGGMGVFLLGRLAVKLSDRYPQISNYFREGMEEIEGRLNSFRGEDETGSDEARH